MTPSYANIFMGKVESDLFEGSPTTPYFWRRFIGDVFFIWTEGEQSLLEFIERMNLFHNTIKFTVDWSDSRVNFLDTSIVLNDGLITTDLYSIPTDKHQYFLHTSCHPNACKKESLLGKHCGYVEFVLQMPSSINYYEMDCVTVTL